jgi:protein-L-isoaspartate(D-aspartate) O-methyltransferase
MYSYIDSLFNLFRQAIPLMLPFNWISYSFIVTTGILTLNLTHLRGKFYTVAMDMRNISPKLLSYYLSLDRSLFIDNKYKAYSDEDRPLPIGFGQTISQPSLVLYMTEMLDLEHHHRVLEIGTGSGYQTALLAQFSQHVYTIEVYEELSIKARSRLESLNLHNVTYIIGDGSSGYSKGAPFDRIMVTASPSLVPTVLLDQLAIWGKMVLPLQSDLLLMTKKEDGSIEKQHLLKVAFVPMVGIYE